jgi:hypothetical protein
LVFPACRQYRRSGNQLLSEISRLGAHSLQENLYLFHEVFIRGYVSPKAPKPLQRIAQLTHLTFQRSEVLIVHSRPSRFRAEFLADKDNTITTAS